MTRDTIYKHTEANPSAFKFDDSVASVFPDMINRSVPGYAASLQGVQHFAQTLVPNNGRCYDLGCSLGAATLAISLGLQTRPATIVAVDNSEAMIARCRNDERLSGRPQTIEYLLEDVTALSIEAADLVVMNYTLQFVPPAARRALLETIYAGLNPGGALIVSEKFSFDDPTIQQLLTEQHHAFKRRNDYSELEIAGKRAALENVLIAETRQTHLQRLQDIGFEHATLWQASLNFGSIIALRDHVGT